MTLYATRVVSWHVYPDAKKALQKNRGKGETEWIIHLKQYKFTVELNYNAQKIAKLGRLGPLSVLRATARCFLIQVKKLQDYACV